MRTHLLAAVTAVFALGLAAPASADRAEVMPNPYRAPRDRAVDLRAENAALRAELARYQTLVAERLDRIDEAARSGRDRRIAFRVLRLTNELRRQLAGAGYDDGSGWGGGPGPGWNQPPPPPPQPAPQAGMPAAEYQQLVAAIGSAHFPADKLAVLDSATPYYLFTTDQVAGLMQAFPFDDARLEVAVRLVPRLVDPQRLYVVYNALQFSSSRDALRQRLGR